MTDYLVGNGQTCRYTNTVKASWEFDLRGIETSDIIIREQETGTRSLFASSRMGRASVVIATELEDQQAISTKFKRINTISRSYR